MKRFCYAVYVILIALPLLALITILASVITVLVSPLFPNTPFSYFPARLWGRLMCYLLWVRVEVEGLAHIDPRQSYVFVLNHQSYFDIFTVYGWLPNIFKWVMKIELRRIPFVGLACQAAGHIFIDRSSPLAASKSIEKAKEQLRNGVSVVIFPEGTRSHDGKMLPFKRGAFRIASDLALPIVPATLVGSFERIPRYTLRLNPGTIRLHIKEPIDVKEFLPDRLPELMEKAWQQVNESL